MAGPHPFGHGRAPSASEQLRFEAIVADLAGDRARARRPRAVSAQGDRRLRSRSGWPAWLAGLVGVGLVGWGGFLDQGAPLLVGAVLAGTVPRWLRLRRLSQGPTSS